jgi:hypothetical protein
MYHTHTHTHTYTHKPCSTFSVVRVAAARSGLHASDSEYDARERRMNIYRLRVFITCLCVLLYTTCTYNMLIVTWKINKIEIYNRGCGAAILQHFTTEAVVPLFYNILQQRLWCRYFTTFYNRGCGAAILQHFTTEALVPLFYNILQQRLWCRYFLAHFYKMNYYVICVSTNKYILRFQNYFGVPSQLCQGEGKKTFSFHFICLRGQYNTVSCCRGHSVEWVRVTVRLVPCCYCYFKFHIFLNTTVRKALDFSAL